MHGYTQSYRDEGDHFVFLLNQSDVLLLLSSVNLLL